MNHASNIVFMQYIRYDPECILFFFHPVFLVSLFAQLITM